MCATTRFNSVVGAALCAFLFSLPLPAQVVPLGETFPLTTDESVVDARHPTLSVSPTGEFTAGWASTRSDFFAVKGRRFDRLGLPLGNEIEIAAPDEYLVLARVADDGMGLAAVWSTFERGAGRGNLLLLRQVDYEGLPIRDPEPLIDTPGWPSIIAFPQGNFVVSWSESFGGMQSQEVEAREYDAEGLPGRVFRVNQGGLAGGGLGRQWQSEIANGPGDQYIVAWQDEGLDDVGRAIFVRRFEYGVGPLGNEIRVDPEVLPLDAKIVGRPRVATDGTGRFLVVWESRTDGNSGYDIWARRFSSSEEPLGEAFRVNVSRGRPAASRFSDGSARQCDHGLAT